MTSTQIAISEAPLVPTMVRGNSAADIRQARRAARVFADRLAPRLCPDVADTLVLVVSSSSPTPCATATAPSCSV